jgi:hypothetical protein
MARGASGRNGTTPGATRGASPRAAGGAAGGATGGATPGATPSTSPGERIAKRLARAGVASRRAAEAMIAEGRIAVNGRRIDSPALNVAPADRITVDGRPLPEAEPARLWRYHKPVGLITTAKDQRGRTTVFESLPPELPRVMSVGRLDITSRGCCCSPTTARSSTGWRARRPAGPGATGCAPWARRPTPTSSRSAAASPSTASASAR